MAFFELLALNGSGLEHGEERLRFDAGFSGGVLGSGVRFAGNEIPITEFRVKWTYSFTDRLAFGVGVNASVWQDVPVPPSIVPTVGGDQVFHENTIVFFGTLVALELGF